MVWGRVGPRDVLIVTENNESLRCGMLSMRVGRWVKEKLVEFALEIGKKVTLLEMR